MRVRRPDIPRGFTVPMIPSSPFWASGSARDDLRPRAANWLRLVGWLVIGLVIYFGYSKSHSKLQTQPLEQVLGFSGTCTRDPGPGNPSTLCLQENLTASRPRPPFAPNSSSGRGVQSAAGRAPSLHILLVGDDPGSQVYVRNKEKAGRETGLTVVVHPPGRAFG
jgi:hypothetical protein